MAELLTLNCNSCGKTKRNTDYYSSSSIFALHTGKVPVCKQCIWEYVKSSDDTEIVKTALRMIDRPFKLELWKSTEDECSRSGGHVFKTYMKNIGMKQYRDLNWSDSEFVIVSKEGVTDESGNTMTDTEYNELVSFFGKGFIREDYTWLTEEYGEFLNRYECDSKGMELLIKEICLTELDIKNRRARGEKVDAQLKTLQDLLGSSNLKPVQETGANAVDQETFGTLIKRFENEKPIPEPDPKWKDVDGISKYIEVFFTGHLARMLGKKDDQIEKKYWQEINKYTVEEPILEDGEEDGRD
ncbi:hypothetical protein ACFVRU_38065 [Streptomyces sp. NPDC057927]